MAAKDIYILDTESLRNGLSEFNSRKENFTNVSYAAFKNSALCTSGHPVNAALRRKVESFYDFVNLSLIELVKYGNSYYNTATTFESCQVDLKLKDFDDSDITLNVKKLLEYLYAADPSNISTNADMKELNLTDWFADFAVKDKWTNWSFNSIDTSSKNANYTKTDADIYNKDYQYDDYSSSSAASNYVTTPGESYQNYANGDYNYSGSSSANSSSNYSSSVYNYNSSSYTGSGNSNYGSVSSFYTSGISTANPNKYASFSNVSRINGASLTGANSVSSGNGLSSSFGSYNNGLVGYLAGSGTAGVGVFNGLGSSSAINSGGVSSDTSGLDQIPISSGVTSSGVQSLLGIKDSQSSYNSILSKLKDNTGGATGTSAMGAMSFVGMGAAGAVGGVGLGAAKGIGNIKNGKLSLKGTKLGGAALGTAAVGAGAGGLASKKVLSDDRNVETLEVNMSLNDSDEKRKKYKSFVDYKNINANFIKKSNTILSLGLSVSSSELIEILLGYYSDNPTIIGNYQMINGILRENVFDFVKKTVTLWWTENGKKVYTFDQFEDEYYPNHNGNVKDLYEFQSLAAVRMQELVRSNSTDKKLVLERGLDFESLKKYDIKEFDSPKVIFEKLNGKIYTDKGFMIGVPSVSDDKLPDSLKEKKVRLLLEVVPGTDAIDLSMISYLKHHILLRDNLSFKITGVEKEKDILYIHMTNNI